MGGFCGMNGSEDKRPFENSRDAADALSNKLGRHLSGPVRNYLLAPPPPPPASSDE